MGARDEPDRYTFLRGGRDPRRAAHENRSAWFATATGPALAALMERDGIAEAQRRLADYRKRQGQAPQVQGMRPGFSRGGKPIPDA